MLSDSNTMLQSLLRDNSRTPASQGQQAGPTQMVHIENVHITNGPAAREFFRELDRHQGDKQQLALRGMIPTDSAVI